MDKKNFDKPLTELLRQYNEQPPLAMHMPGHKRNTAMLGNALPWELDVTEIPPFDDLHQPAGVLAASQRRAADLFGSKHAFYLVNGSTCGLLAAIRAAAQGKKQVIAARNCHQSVFHAIELCGAMPHLVEPTFEAQFGVFGSVTPAAIERALSQCPDASAVVLTSPTYAGVVSDIAAISALCKTHGAALIVDEAHGAHLPFSDFFPESAVALGADCVIQSLHKTLPSLTQTAILHVCSDAISRGEIARQLRIFQSSSPSYVLLSAIDYCVRALETQGGAWFAAYANRLREFYVKAAALRHIKLLRENPRFFARDPSKLVLSAPGLSGAALAEKLLALGVQCEMAGAGYALLMSSVCDTDDTMRALLEALTRLDGTLRARDSHLHRCAPAAQQILPPLLALSRESKLQETALCVGEIAAEYLWAYPPGIPWLLPGQRITQALVDSIVQADGVRLYSSSGAAPEKIRIDAG
ncbi:MAG: aminotransferase class I/II-fold pyridoxal phosphate-dependent enzyme [Oscillospiraceae bacterium]|jgi:arginine/lysine/ornithine decarboxylase|nr:aminotransferase class I/II-fold pyridoxal phosphate-dependent enzyme [Oscillospiraceae bacterium]